MADRFWVGNGGDWSDAATHWSASSGGAPGASLPTSADSVYFDINSFTLAGQTVTVDTTVNCFDMDWTGALNDPTFANSSAYSKYIYGSLTLISGMTMSGINNGSFSFMATSIGKTIITAEKTCYSFSFLGVGGGWTLQDALTVSYFYQIYGTLNTNGQTISCINFTCSGIGTKTLTLGASIITCSGNITFASTGLTMTANTATFIITGNSKIFAGGGVTFNNVEFQGTPTTVTGNNIFNDLKITAGKTAIMTTGTTQTIATLHSGTPGSPAIMSCATGTVIVTNASIQDITATGGAIFKAYNSTDAGGNTGWIFLLIPAPWAVGQIVTISDASRGISGQYTIQKVTRTKVKDGLWNNKIEYGGRLLGIEDYLTAIVSAQQNKRTATVTIINKLEQTQDSVAVSDSVAASVVRLLPFLCGDVDAICGQVILSASSGA